ncbi:hypothetical protein BX600DRAFT_518771 [Xylariales sp. PMI_506]|nr:hypothetical protein BX600DRAFT_518771 [Xylariales sp. PMI_506]
MFPILRPWAAQIWAIIGSFLCTAGLALFLAEYDGRPIFSWYGVTLNAIIAVLSVAAKGLLLLAVEESFSQWKWILFYREPRALIEFQRIDEASRGPLGSVQMLFSNSKAVLTRLGSVIILISLAIDPFTQQLVQYGQDVKYTSNGRDANTIPWAQRYSKGNEFVVQLAGNTYADADFAMQSAVLYGLSQPLTDVVQQLSFTCPTSNCTWDSFDSLAVCSECHDLSANLEPISGSGDLFELLEQDNGAAVRLNGTAFRLANGLIMDNFDGWEYAAGRPRGGVMITSFGTANASETNALQDIDTLIWAMSIFKVHPATSATARWPDLPLEATECGLYYCVNRYTPTVQKGVLLENTMRVTSATRNDESWQAIDPQDDSRWLNYSDAQRSSIAYNVTLSAVRRSDLQLTTPASGATPLAAYNISQSAVDSISSYLNSTFSGQLHVFTGDADMIPGRLNGFYMNDSQVQYSPSIIQSLWTSSNITDSFNALAVSMSNAIRAGADYNTVATGSTGIVTTFYMVQWGWIALHVVVVFAGAAFLIVTMWQSAGVVPVLKSNSLATMGSGAQIGSLLNWTTDTKEMERRAKNEIVSFNMSESYQPADSAMIPLTAVSSSRDAQSFMEYDHHSRMRAPIQLPSRSSICIEAPSRVPVS